LSVAARAAKSHPHRTDRVCGCHRSGRCRLCR
jgi:hypothetical protein